MATQAEKAAELKKLGYSTETINKAIEASNLQATGKKVDTGALVAQAKTEKPTSVAQPTTNGTQAYQQAVKKDTNTYTFDTKSGTYNTGAGQNKQAADYWNSLSYADQQKAIDNKPELKSYLSNQGLTQKRADVDTSTATQFNVQTREAGTQPTKSESQRDYQSVDDARMQEMINNLDYYKVNNPSLFSDYQTYSDFFLAGKNRSPEQTAAINQYYFGQKQMQEYALMSAKDLANGYLGGTIDAGYLSYLQGVDPQKFAEIQGAITEIQNSWANQSDYESFLAQEGYSKEDMGNGNFRAWNKREMLWRDEDNNGVNDIYEIPVTEEEKNAAAEMARIQSENQELDDEMAGMLDDLIEKYPEASLTTLRLLASDRTADLQELKRKNNVQLVQLNGIVSYQQSLRQEQQKAAQQSMADLQKNYGMYYQFSPEGISELAQAQYAATNITLDQADTGTYTQKQMALESVLAPIYEQYGSIIQRPQAQVINDVIAYAQQNGVSLSQALEANFMTQLKGEPAYQAIQSQLASGGTGTWKAMSGDYAGWLYNEATGEYKAAPGTDATQKTSGGASYTPISKQAAQSSLSKLQTEYPENSKYKNGWCGELVNKYLQDSGSNIHLGNEIETKTKYINKSVSDGPSEGDVVVWDFSNAPASSNISQDSRDYGHVAIVTKVYGDGSFDVYQQNGDGNRTVGTAHITPNQYIAGYIDPTKVSGRSEGDYSTDDYMDFETGVLNFIPIQLRNTEKETEKIITKVKSYYDRGLSQYDAALIQMGFNVQNASEEGKKLADNLISILSTVPDVGEVFDSTFMTTLSRKVNGGDYEGALAQVENLMSDYMMTSGKTGVSSTDMMSAAGALSALNKYKASTYGEGANKTLKNIIGAGGEDIGKFNARRSSLSVALRGLGYTDEDIDSMLPTLTTPASKFSGTMASLQDTILDRYNAQRKRYGLPPVSLSYLLGNTSLETMYGINSEGEALKLFN